MPKNPNVKRVMVIGSGPIVIGQAAEFDYAGTQACRSLKEEGVEVILVNSNPATIMTDKDIADKVYIELPYACEEAGDLSQPIAEGRLKKEQAVLMSDFLKSDADEDQIAAGTTYFKSVGMALFDICVAQKLLAKSKEKQQ